VNKGKRFPPHPIKRADVLALIRVAGDGTEVGVRNRAILTMMYRTGARTAELHHMHLNDIRWLDDGRMIVRIAVPKGYSGGAMPREIGIDKKATQNIMEWLAVRGSGDGPLFITRNGTGVSPVYLRQLLPRLARRAGIQRRVHPHAMRHSFAQDMERDGVSMMDIMGALGHQSLVTTQKYLQRVGVRAEEVVYTTMNRSW
jgi:site-specific recombinase XerD